MIFYEKMIPGAEVDKLPMENLGTLDDAAASDRSFQASKNHRDSLT